MKKSICITGVSRGIGQALAREFLGLGHTVYGGVRKLESARSLEEEFPAQFFPISMDVRNEDSLADAKNTIQSHSSSLDILINNAAILKGHEAPALPSLDIDDIAVSFDVNTLGPLRTAKILYPLLEKSKTPTIANITSVMGSIKGVVGPRAYGYSVSKAALNMATRLLYRNLQAHHFKVFCLHPGWVRTDMGGDAAPFSSAESAKGLCTQILSWEHGDPEFLDFQGNKIAW